MIRLASDFSDLNAAVHTPVMLTYADLFQTRDELRDFRLKFPGSQVKLIDRGLGDPARVATACAITDTEPRALTVEETVSRITLWVSQGADFPTVYANRSTMPAVIDGLAGVHGWWRWWATLDGTMRIPGHENDMVQFAGVGMTGGNYDLTVIYDDRWHPSPV